jgi:hypothetical protein
MNCNKHENDCTGTLVAFRWFYDIYKYIFSYSSGYGNPASISM